MKRTRTTMKGIARRILVIALSIAFINSVTNFTGFQTVNAQTENEETQTENEENQIDTEATGTGEVVVNKTAEGMMVLWIILEIIVVIAILGVIYLTIKKRK